MRVVHVDPSTLDRARERARPAGFAYGLVVGQRNETDERDVVIDLIFSPDAPSARRPVTTTEGISAEWIGQHAVNVARALPGGVDVLGMFVFAASEQSAAKAAAVKMHVLPKSGALETNLVFLFIAATGNAVSAKLVQPGTASTSFAEVKTQALAGKFAASTASVVVDETFLVAPAEGESIADALSKGDLRSYLARVDNAIVQRTEDGTCQVYLPEASAADDALSTLSSKPAHAVKLSMHLDIRAYTFARDIESVSKHIRQDLKRSLLARVELLVDDLCAAEEDGSQASLFTTKSPASVSSSSSLVPPRRTVVNGPLGIVWSDYSLPDDTPSDTIDRLQTFLGLASLSPEDLSSREQFASVVSPKQPAPPSSKEAKVVPPSRPAPESGSSVSSVHPAHPSQRWPLIVSGCVALLLAILLGLALR